MDASVREHPFFKRILIVYFLEREKNMDNKEFYINCDGIALHAKLDFPEDQNEKYPLVIIIAGESGIMAFRDSCFNAAARTIDAPPCECPVR